MGEEGKGFYHILHGLNPAQREAVVHRDSPLLVVAGAGSSDFAGDQRFTISGGFGYRLAMNDWLMLRLDARDYVFKSDLLGSDETLHNFEFTGGLTVFF